MSFCIAYSNICFVVGYGQGKGYNMFNKNLKRFRKQKGLTQEELAERLHVVRQTISKWEKGLSVPDAELLIRIAEIFETSVGVLLGDTIELPDNTNIIAQKLEQLNALLAEKNRQSKRVWRIISFTLISIVMIIILSIVLLVTLRTLPPKSHLNLSPTYTDTRQRMGVTNTDSIIHDYGI